MPVFHPVAAMGGKFTAPVLADHRINDFIGDAYTLLLQTTRYLPWRPLIVPYQFNDAPFQRIVQPSVARRMTQVGPCHIVGFVPDILAARRGVTSYFTAYRQFGAPMEWQSFPEVSPYYFPR